MDVITGLKGSNNRGKRMTIVAVNPAWVNGLSARDLPWQQGLAFNLAALFPWIRLDEPVGPTAEASFELRLSTKDYRPSEFDRLTVEQVNEALDTLPHSACARVETLPSELFRVYVSLTHPLNRPMKERLLALPGVERVTRAYDPGNSYGGRVAVLFVPHDTLIPQMKVVQALRFIGR